MIPAAERPPREATGRSNALYLAIGLLALLFAAKHVVNALVFPPFTGHDEVAHFGYLRTLAFEHRLPLLWDPLPDDLTTYRDYALDWSQGPGYQYTALHPPLYYVVMVPVMRATVGATPEYQLYAVRLAGVWIGLLTTGLAFVLARTLFPSDSFIALVTTMLVAMQPQVSYEAAIVNNDALAIAATTGVMWLLVRAIRDGFSTRASLLVGAAVGVSLLAKSTALVMAPVIGLAVVIVLGRNWRQAVRVIAAMLIPAVAIVAPWYVHLYRTYGDFSGLSALAALQAAWNKPEATFFDLLFSARFVTERFKETWGEFGWRRAPIDESLLWVVGLASGAAVFGLVRFAGAALGMVDPSDPRNHPAPWQAHATLVMALACAASYIAVVQFGTQFVLTQARYFFPAVGCAAVLASVGFRELTPRTYRPFVQAALALLLVLLNLLVYTRAVIPSWYFPR